MADDAPPTGDGGQRLLVGRTLVVTGGSSGNGRAIALAAARHGAAVVVADRQAEPREGGPPTAELIAASPGGRAAFVACDVRRAADLERVADRAEQLGGLDVWVNNAGILGAATPVVETSDDDFDLVVDVNLRGTFLGSRVAARRMLSRGSGAIVNVSSVAAHQAARSSAMYGATKAAVRLFSQGLANELGPSGIRVNCVAPGVVRTQFTESRGSLDDGEKGERLRRIVPLGRVGEPDDVADAVIFLSSDLSRYVTGTSLVVDGGLTSHVPN